MKNKSDFIQELIQTAQDSIWKNELALKYTELHGEGTDEEKQLKIKACKYAIEKDTEYIEFLKNQ